ncbi:MULTISPECIES: hypothetical protein [Geobacillus]|uniref:Uncharacterized protein n=1 Tax=Geobacillus subterraneus TaxID=129338 RepID=A0A679FJ54_9BACL|nr:MULTISPECIES: hypothetical protein [Geobacillus]BBW95743.1 hypothetical protein GsuE55_05760 [Geobacillus subterraneus]
MTNNKRPTGDDERTRRNNWRLFFLLVAASLLWGAAYWIWIVK